jgi:hypothetical protein
VDADIPNILGMPFLFQVNPTISWQTRYMKVRKGSRSLLVPLAIFHKTQGNDLVQKDKKITPFSNSFAGLEVDTEQLPSSAERVVLTQEGEADETTLGEVVTD